MGANSGVAPKGGDMEQWPLELRVRQFPKPRRS